MADEGQEPSESAAAVLSHAEIIRIKITSKVGNHDSDEL